MSKTSPFIFAVLVLAATPVFAGSLSFDNGQTAWHSTECTKPNQPASLMSASSDSSGESMNTLMSEHNAYVDAAQGYMNCISQEAGRDQNKINQTISDSAEKEIAAIQSSIDSEAAVLKQKQ